MINEFVADLNHTMWSDINIQNTGFLTMLNKRIKSLSTSLPFNYFHKSVNSYKYPLYNSKCTIHSGRIVIGKSSSRRPSLKVQFYAKHTDTRKQCQKKVTSQENNYTRTRGKRRFPERSRPTRGNTSER